MMVLAGWVLSWCRRPRAGLGHRHLHTKRRFLCGDVRAPLDKIGAIPSSAAAVRGSQKQQRSCGTMTEMDAESSLSTDQAQQQRASKMPLRGVIFDMDNTLTTDGHIDFAEMRRRAKIPHGADILHHLDTLRGPERQAAEEAIHQVEIESHAAMELNMGCVRMLDRIRAYGHPHHPHNVRTAILTRNSSASVQVFLDRFGLNNTSNGIYFDAIMARDSVPGIRPKPAPDAILYLCDLWQLKPQECIMIGDDTIDIQTGQNAHCGATMLLKYPRNQQYWQGHATFVVEDLDEAADILQTLF